MNKKLSIVGILAVLMLSSFLVSSVSANAFPVLPPTEVTIDIDNETPNDYPFDVRLSNFPAGTFDITPGTYTGWCINLDLAINRALSYQAMLYSSCPKPAEFTLWNQEELNKINYILNNKVGTEEEVQVAIWLALGYSVEKIAQTGLPVTGPAQAMADASNAEYISGPCDILGIICVPTGAQQIMLELRIPCDLPGLSPGFWKHNVGVYLGEAKGSYSDPENSPVVDKESMETFLSNWSDAELWDLYNALNTKGGGATGAATRVNAANVFNAAAGLSDYMD